MSRSTLNHAVVIATLGASLSLSPQVFAEILADSKASVELRNFYFNRDFRQDGAAQSKAEEWAQGFLLRYESGYTDGTVGVGVDALGLLGVKLDSSPDRTGTGLLKSDREKPNRAQDEYGELGLTAKLRASQSTLKVGTLLPKLPVALYNDSRLLPQTFRGAWVNSAEVDNLSLDLGRFDRINLRNSSDNEEMAVFNGGNRNIALGRTKTSDRFDFAGASYKWSPNFSTGYHYGGLDGLYQQHYLTLNHLLPIAEGQSLKSDIRWAHSTDDGGSNVDNDAFGALFTYALGGHAFGLGYQRMSGDSGFANINGTDAYLVNLVQINDFGNEDERSWQARYDYNFAALGIPGLTFMTRYLSGDNVDLRGAAGEGKEWERNTDIAYVVQSGPLKNLGLKWRNATARSNFGSDLDENRLILSYVLPLW
ncbi:OprD family porin [Pseudomonas sp. TCU-HL1]|uniref:OprD family porin n=1 Tax=Pseudomonas sp. TCU-HL1 TaxID=1856685 RepID=UPI00083DFFF1|nr:OprD family porin [Pseudomonas sp. TCU-HL1]AOE85988.1 tricarboxylate porin [Pseudomonas sp. TCU-HL1]